MSGSGWGNSDVRCWAWDAQVRPRCRISVLRKDLYTTLPGSVGPKLGASCWICVLAWWGGGGGERGVSGFCQAFILHVARFLVAVLRISSRDT